jgi:GNAT superfamily N-acetyltransferase
MVQIVQVNDNAYNDQIRELLVEYFEWGNTRLNKEFGVNLDVEAIINRDIEEIDIYFPPHGGLFLGIKDSSYVGMIFLAKLLEGVAEIRRMYVRPQYRRLGIGRELFEAALQEGRRLGYSKILLDSPRSWREAHALYMSAGFREIDEYSGSELESEVPAEFRQNWVFMALEL